jgi:hypothetical protein
MKRTLIIASAAIVASFVSGAAITEYHTVDRCLIQNAHFSKPVSLDGQACDIRNVIIDPDSQ